MGAVHLAWAQRAQGHCAIKVLNIRKDRRGSAERSFNREVRAMARLDHESIAAVYDFGRTKEGSPFLAMEHVPGESLHAYMRGPWSWGRRWLLLDGLLAGLGHAHARGLIHRDLKPGNVLIVPGRTGRDAIKLVDFGIALSVPEAARASRRIEGTPAYIAPEAAAGNVVDAGPWTDLYSLGVILFELLTGDLPYHGRHLLAHHQRSPLPKVVIRPEAEAPEGITHLVLRLLAKAPVDRYRHVADVRDALNRLGPPAAAEPFDAVEDRLGLLDDDTTAPGQESLAPLQGPAGPGLVHLRNPAIVGRDKAQAVLRGAADAAIAGVGPQVVIIEGEGGLGKSTLARWLREQVEESGSMRTLCVRSEPQTRQAGLREAILRYIGAPSLTREKAPAVFARVFDDERNQRGATEALWPAPGAESVEQRIKRAAWMVHDLSRELPFMLWCDDAQWSPEGRVLQLALRLAREERLTHMLIVISLRPTDRGSANIALRALNQLPRCTTLRLRPLSPAVLSAGLNQLAPLPPGIAEAAALQAVGNPLLALEAVRTHLRAEGMGEAPTDPSTLLARRVDEACKGPLGGELRSLLVRATLLGRAMSLVPLSRLCRVAGDPSAPALTGDQQQTAALLERAVNEGLLKEANPGQWRFSHDLMRAYLRDACRTLPNYPALNLACAQLRRARAERDEMGIEMEVVSRHYWEGGEHAEALATGLIAVTRLHNASLMGNVTSFARRLIEWDDAEHLLSAEQRCDLRLLGSDACEHAGQPHDAERHAAAALGIASRNWLPTHATRAACRLGLLHLRNDALEEAEQVLREAVRQAGNSQDAQSLALAQETLGLLFEHRGELRAARQTLETGLEVARGAGLVSEALDTRMALARIDRLEGRLERALRAFRQVADDAREAGMEIRALEARLEEGMCAWTADDPEAAEQAFEDVLEGTRGRLFRIEFQAALGAAWAHAAQRHFTDCELSLMQAEELRFDVRMADPETETLRRAIRDLAQAARRPDILQRVDRLAVMGTRTHHTLSPPTTA